MPRFVQLSVFVLMLITFSCEKPGRPADVPSSAETHSQDGVAERRQDFADFSLEDIIENPERVHFCGNSASTNEEVQAILKNKGFFQSELTIDGKKYLLQLAQVDGANGLQNVAILSKQTPGSFVPTMILPLKARSVPSFYESDGKLLINFKQETDWGAEVKIENDRLVLTGFEE